MPIPTSAARRLASLDAVVALAAGTTALAVGPGALGALKAQPGAPGDRDPYFPRTATAGTTCSTTTSTRALHPGHRGAVGLDDDHRTGRRRTWPGSTST